MYDRKETTQQAAARLGLPEQFTAMHDGYHVCIDGRHYRYSCLITDPDCDDIARSRLARTRPASAEPASATPECPYGHGAMILRPVQVQTKEQAWCGTWYDCPPGPPGDHCSSSVLVPSPELIAHLGAAPQ